MACKELEKRYKEWCQIASSGNVEAETLDGQSMTIGPLDRNVSTTPLVLRNDQGKVVLMQPVASLIKATAQRIDSNFSRAKEGTRATGVDYVEVDLRELTTCFADLSYHKVAQNRNSCMAVHLLPFTIGKWVSKIRDEEKQYKTTWEALLACFQALANNERFRCVAVYEGYRGLLQGTAEQREKARAILQFENSDDSIMELFRQNLDLPEASETKGTSMVGLYLCRSSMIDWTERHARKALGNYMKFSPSNPIEHILADRLFEASRVHGGTSHPIRRFAGKSGSSPIIREIPHLGPRILVLIRKNRGMIQVTRLLEGLTKELSLQVSGQRNGSKERGMLDNIRHATALRPNNRVIFFLNSAIAEGQDDCETFAPPVLSDFDLRADCSGTSKPSWAKSLLELERITEHDTVNDARGSTTVSMAGFPFQCHFVLPQQEGHNFYYCPYRFAGQQDAAEHVRAVHQGEGISSETCAKIAQVDSLLEDTEFGKKMRPINELELIRKLKLDEKAEQLRCDPNLHESLLQISLAVTQNTRLLQRLEKSRAERTEQWESLKRTTKEVERHMPTAMSVQLFNQLNREITEVKKFMLSPSALVAFQAEWDKAKKRKDYILGNAYQEFIASNEQQLWLERTVGEEARRYGQRVQALGGIDLGATPAGAPGGGIRLGKSNVLGMLTQDLIEKSRQAVAMHDVDEALIATNQVATNRTAAFKRVVSEYDQTFGASNVIPAANPLLAAEGWDDDDDDDDKGAAQMKDEVEDKKGDQRTEPATEVRPEGAASTRSQESNPRKRLRPLEYAKTEHRLEERALVPLAKGLTTRTAPKKVQITEIVVPENWKSVLKLEVPRIFDMVKLTKTERELALENVKETFSFSFHSQFRTQAEKTVQDDALSGSQIRTLMDPLRDNVSVLVITDPRLVMCPTGILWPALSCCISLIDRFHKTVRDNHQLLCLLLAKGICDQLQPHFWLSTVGLQIVCEALKRVLSETIERGREGHWNVVTSLVQTLNANLAGFWNAALLRRYHNIEDPSHETKLVDEKPEKTYAPLDKLPSVDAVAARIRRPIILETSATSVSPMDSKKQFPQLRTEEARVLREQVVEAVAGRKTRLVSIKDTMGMDAQAWIRRLFESNADAEDDPYAMCAWLRGPDVTSAECNDEKKHQCLRLARCCICTDPLGSLPFQGWCCLSGVKSFESLVEQALKDVTDATQRASRREYLRQVLVNKVVSQPKYPSFHFWHRHCKRSLDDRRLVQAFATAARTKQTMKTPTFDECPLCRTKYPRDKSSFPCMKKISKRIVQMEKKVTTRFSPAKKVLPPPVARLKIVAPPKVTNGPEESEPMQEGIESGHGTNDVPETSDSCVPTTEDVTSTGVVFMGTLFQTESGCQMSPAALIPPSSSLPLPAHGLTLYDDMVNSSNDSDPEALWLQTANVPTTSVAPCPLNIGEVFEIVDEIVAPQDEHNHDGFQDAMETEEYDPSALLNLLESTSLSFTKNMEASILSQDARRESHETNVEEPLSIEPIAAVAEEFSLDISSFTQRAIASIGGSGPCFNKGCRACPYMMPRSNQLGPYRLKTVIDCTSDRVLYVSMCQSCATIHGFGYAIGSMRSAIEVIQRQSVGQRATLLSRCVFGHTPLLVGLERCTTENDRAQKEALWKTRLNAMMVIEATVT